MPLGKYFQLNLTLLPMNVFLFLIVLSDIVYKRKAKFLSKLKYSVDNMLFKLFLKNMQDELLLIRCY